MDEDAYTRFSVKARNMSALAALAVVVIHAGNGGMGSFAAKMAHQFLGWGLCTFAVPWFFFASGYFFARHLDGLAIFWCKVHFPDNTWIERKVNSSNFHNRFLIVDDHVYHLGASLKDLGRKLFAFNKMGLEKAVIMALVFQTI